MTDIYDLIKRINQNTKTNYKLEPQLDDSCFTKKEKEEIDKLCKDGVIESYRGRCFVCNVKELHNGTAIIFVLTDEYKQVHTIIANNEIVYTKEI